MKETDDMLMAARPARRSISDALSDVFSPPSMLEGENPDMNLMEESAKGPNGVARECEEKIAELLIQRDALPRSQRREINQKLHRFRHLLAFCKTRAGYVSSDR